eukprot:scaffold274050_cov19-Tisochrysis_lutea.AAC.2
MVAWPRPMASCKQLRSWSENRWVDHGQIWASACSGSQGGATQSTREFHCGCMARSLASCKH